MKEKSVFLETNTSVSFSLEEKYITVFSQYISQKIHKTKYTCVFMSKGDGWLVALEVFWNAINYIRLFWNIVKTNISIKKCLNLFRYIFARWSVSFKLEQ